MAITKVWIEDGCIVCSSDIENIDIFDINPIDNGENNETGDSVRRGMS